MTAGKIQIEAIKPRQYHKDQGHVTTVFVSESEKTRRTFRRNSQPIVRQNQANSNNIQTELT
jgi:hypothetical protein